MKKIIFIVSILMVVIVLVSCNDTEPIETEIPIGDMYELFYTRDDFDVYKLKELPNEHTDDLVELGVYKGDSYYLTSGTYLEYYVVVKDTVQKDLLEALEADWFELEELVENFNLPSAELGFEAYLDEELLQAVRDVKNSLSGESFEELAQHNLARSTPLGMTIKTPVRMEDNLTITPYTKDQEWIDVQIKYYTMLEEIVLNGYQQGIYVNLKDFLNSPESLDTYWLSNDQEFQLIISLEEQTLYSRVITYVSSDFTEKLQAETIYSYIDPEGSLYLEKYVYSYLSNSIRSDIYKENEGLYVIVLGDENREISSDYISEFSVIVGAVTDNVQFRMDQRIINNISNLEKLGINFYNENKEIYLSAEILSNQESISSVGYINSKVLGSAIPEKDIPALLKAYKNLLYIEEDILTNGLTFRVDIDRISNIVDDLQKLKDYVYDYENYYAKPNYPSNLLNSLKNIEIEGNYFNVLSENGEIDLSVLGDYKKLYQMIDLYMITNIDRYKQYLSEYDNSLTSESKSSALRGLYTTTYDLYNIIIWDTTLIEYSIGDTLVFNPIDLELSISYDYSDNVTPGDIANDEESISNAASYWYQYIQDNYDSMFYKFNNFGIADYNNPLLVDYIRSKAIPIE